MGLKLICPHCGYAWTTKTNNYPSKCPNCRKPIFDYYRQQGGGCFIATAAYGTPFAKDIDVLRKWRDISLMKITPGRLFVILYYKISPPIAFIVSKSEGLKSIVRNLLKPLIKYLNKK